MKTYANMALVRQEDGKIRLFSLPSNALVKEGTAVICETARGEKYGVMACDSFIVESGRALKALMMLTGATQPIRNVLYSCRRKTVTNVVEEKVDLETMKTVTEYDLRDGLPF